MDMIKKFILLSFVIFVLSPFKVLGADTEILHKASALIKNGLPCKAEGLLLELLKGENPDPLVYPMLARAYYGEGLNQKAEEYLLKGSEVNPLIKDYILKMLIDLYISEGRYKEALEKLKLIKEEHLRKYALRTQAEVFILLGMDKEAIDTLSRYARAYPDDWETRLMYASLLESAGRINEAIEEYKKIYIGASEFAERAFDELKILEAEPLTVEELFKRAENLFNNGLYKDTEDLLKEIIERLSDKYKSRAMFILGMSQFNQKKYRDAANSFAYMNKPKWFFWRARSFYRLSEKGEFINTRDEFERLYPSHRRLGDLYIMEAEEWVRKGEIDRAVSIYRRAIERFPDSKEEALWGIAWAYYNAGRYKEALNYFTQLSNFTDSREYFKYLYWKARTRQKIDKNPSPVYFKDLPYDTSFYGYLIRLMKNNGIINENITDASDNQEKTIDDIDKSPQPPVSEEIKKIRALILLGMIEEAQEELDDALKKFNKMNDLSALCRLALKAGAYKDLVYFAEPRQELEFLPFSYPMAYWDTILLASTVEGVNEYLIAAIIREESRYDPQAISWAGAMGLMQLMPHTAKRIMKDINTHLPEPLDLFNERANIIIGTHYLSSLLKEFKTLPLAIAAYNAGENKVREWMDRFMRDDIVEFIENIPYKETKRYVKKVLKSYWQYRAVNGLDITFFIDGNVEGFTF